MLCLAATCIPVAGKEADDYFCAVQDVVSALIEVRPINSVVCVVGWSFRMVKRHADCFSRFAPSLQAYETRNPVNLTGVKNRAARRYGLPGVPKVRRCSLAPPVPAMLSARCTAGASLPPFPTLQLVDILTALPDNYRDQLRPFLRAKPVRSASGISVVVRHTVPPTRTQPRVLYSNITLSFPRNRRRSCASLTVARTLP